MSPKQITALMLLLLILAAYGNCFTAAITLDSAQVITHDPRVQQVSFDAIRRAFTEPYYTEPWPQDLHRPITTLSYQLNALLGKSPAVFHAFNLLLHWINALLIAALARRWMHWIGALGAAALFAVHPLTVESVTNLVGRADQLAMLALLLGLQAHIAGRPLLLGLCGLIAVFSKESGIMLAGVILAWNLCFGGWNWKSYAALIPSWVALLAARAAIVTPFPLEMMGGENPLALMTLTDRVMTALGILGRYLALWIWQSQLSSDYSFRQLPMWSETWRVAIWFLPLIGLGGFVWCKRRQPAILFAVLAGAAVMLPTSNLILPIGTIMAERFMYLPAAMLAIALVLGFRLHPILVAGLVLGLGARTALRNLDWQDDLTIWTSAVKASPESFRAHQELAISQIKRGMFKEGLAHAVQAVQIDQGLPPANRSVKAYAVLAAALSELGRKEEAIAACEQGLANEQARNELLRRVKNDPNLLVYNGDLHRVYEFLKSR